MSNSTSRPRSRTKRRVVAGGLVAGLIALGMWLSTLLPGLGLGLGGGSGEGLGDRAAKTSPQKTSKTESPVENKPQPPTDIVTVRIDGKRLLLKHLVEGQSVYRPATQAEIVAQAKRVIGNDRGERVRIELLANAVLDLRDELKTALKDAGLKEQEIPEVREFR